MGALPQIDPVALVRAAEQQLEGAIAQSLPSDDRMIVERIQKARALLQQILAAA